MPTVPGQMLPNQPGTTNDLAEGQKPSQTDLLMALAQMHSLGRLDSTTAVKDAPKLPKRRRA